MVYSQEKGKASGGRENAAPKIIYFFRMAPQKGNNQTKWTIKKFEKGSEKNKQEKRDRN